MNISQAAKQLDLTSTTLRYYETIGLIPPIERTASGVRNYSEENVDWIYTIKCMRDAGLSIDSLIQYNALYLEGAQTYDERKTILMKERQNLVDKIAEFQTTLARLDYKLNNFYSSDGATICDTENPAEL
ncbi:MerR family transcriptional regulator [Enterococcus sp. HY326]|uniref:MerR family transcriptional regulator n=1 Tax=Enterococcus sp. HY326 TaxID=2971265 RepID=UPI00223F7117|nr:MerR family transcriptional regulator [Enterococcus sp. HY326]